MTTTTDAMSLPCGPYLQNLLVRAAEALEPSDIPAWDEDAGRNLQRLLQGRWLPYWTGSTRRRHLSRGEQMALAALTTFSSKAQGPAWANTEASDARRLADAIREGRCAIW